METGMDDTRKEKRDINTLPCGAVPMEDFYMPDNNEEAGSAKRDRNDID
jgi:hypothetical protein